MQATKLEYDSMWRKLQSLRTKMTLVAVGRACIGRIVRKMYLGADEKRPFPGIE